MIEPNRKQRTFCTEIRVVVFFAILILIGFFSTLVLDKTFIPYDAVGWHYPELAFLARWLGRGVFPLWNPHFYSGMPFVGDMQAPLFYPLNLVVLGLSGKFGGELSYRVEEYLEAFHFVLAGVSAYWLGREFRLPRTPAMFFGMAYMLGPTLASQAQHYGLIMSLAWLPLIILCFQRTVTSPDLRWSCGLAVCSTLYFFTGISAAVASASIFFPILSLWVLMRMSDRKKIFFRLMLAAFITVCLSAVKLLPVVETARLSFVGTQKHDFSIGPPIVSLFTMFDPSYFNSAGNYWGPLNPTLTFFFVPSLIFLFASVSIVSDRSKSARWIGLIALFSLFASTGGIEYLRPLFIVIPSTLRGALEMWEVRKFFDLGIFLMAAMGFDYLFRVSDLNKKKAAWLAVLSTFFLITAILSIVVWQGIVWHHHAFMSSNLSAQANSNVLLVGASQAFIYLFLGGTLCYFLTGRSKRTLNSKLAVIIAFILVAVPQFEFDFNMPFNQAKGGCRTLLSPTEIDGGSSHFVNFLQGQRANASPFRFDYSGSQSVGIAIASALWDLDSATGNNPLMPMDYSRFWYGLAPVANPGDRTPLIQDIKSPLLNLLNVRYVMASSNDGVETNLSKLYPGASAEQFQLRYSDWFKVFENRDVLPRAFLAPNQEVVPNRDSILRKLASEAFNLKKTVLTEEPCGKSNVAGNSESNSTVQYSRLDANSVKINVAHSSGGLLVVLDPYWPGWQATVDGRQENICRVDYLFRGIPLPAGDHIVMMRYFPDSFRIGLILFFVGCLVAFGTFFRERSHCCPVRLKKPEAKLV